MTSEHEPRARLLCLMQLPPPVHGVTLVNQRILESRLLASQFELDVVPLRFPDSIADIGRMSARKLTRTIEVSARLAWRMLVNRPDAVYFTLTPRGNAFYRDCLFVGVIKAFGVPRIFHLHEKEITNEHTARWKRRLYAWAFRNAWVIQLSPLLDRGVFELVPEDHVLFVANGIPGPTNPANPRSHDGIPRLLYLSNMILEKGPLVLLEALGALAARGLPFEATFAGAPADRACIAAFEQGVQRMGLADRVRYIGPAYGDAKDALLAAHDLFVLPTYRDAFPLVLLEAMQHGLPVVSTREGAIPEIVEDGETGFLVPPQDPAALADRLAVLLADPAQRQQMGERGRARYRQRFTFAAFERNLGQALGACVAAVTRS